MKIGIVTMYHDSTNYGGHLQAYALQHVCESLGYQTEVISYYNGSTIRWTLANTKRFLRSVRNRILPTTEKHAHNCIAKRKKAIQAFHKKIPHSSLFCHNTISKANAHYDCFIVGSDQVWNPAWLNPFYRLEFVDQNKYCFSYAASLGVSSLNESQQRLFAELLKPLKAVSVREEHSVDVLRNLTDKKVEYVLDPTLLLNAEQWGKLSACRQIEEKYVFCFLFGNQDKPRRLAKEYAERKNCKLVTIPFLHGTFREADMNFGDYQLSDVSPEQFLSLIKHADCTFTDSFHATVFSHIFEKNFISYAPDTNKMQVRMLSLTKLFGTEKRFLGDESSTDITYIESLEDIDYENSRTEFINLRNFSLKFLEDNLKQVVKHENDC